MAKRKVRKKVNRAKDFTVKKVDFGDGFVVEMKCRVVGLQYLEETYNKPLEKLDFGTGRVSDLINLFVALAISTYPDMSVEEAKKKVGRLDIDQLGEVVGSSSDIFGVEGKNAVSPSEKVMGNVLENQS